MLLGLVLAGLRPVWVRPGVDAATGLPGAVPAAAVSRALADHPGAVAVMVGDPSYVGTTGDVGGLAAVAHEAGVPLVVDAAWGAHFGLHPALPPHPLAAGADAMVISAHKTLPAVSQAAVVLARRRPARRREARAGVRGDAHDEPRGGHPGEHRRRPCLLERAGEELGGGSSAGGARTAPAPRPCRGSRCRRSGVDAAKLVVLLPGTGARASRWRRTCIEAGFPVELADRDTIVAMVNDRGQRHAVATFAAALVGRSSGTRRPAPGRSRRGLVRGARAGAGPRGRRSSRPP